MNYSKYNFELLNFNVRSPLSLYQKTRLWCQKFWQFSLFYGDYLASLHSQKK